MKRNILLLAGVVLFFAFLGSCLADDSNGNAQKEIFNLGEIVVTDRADGNDIAVNNIITTEDIQKSGSTNAAEALDFVPGVNIAQTTKGMPSVTIQGFSQKDILILIDGVPYYETKNGPLDLQQIPSSIIGKIEVVKGASSVLYGPNAMGGVVNIVTRKGVTGTAGVIKTELGAGGYGRGSVTLNHGSESGFSILGTIDYRTRDSLRFSNDYEPHPSTIKGMGKEKTYIVDDGGKKNNSDLDSLNLWTRLGYAATDEAELYASLYHFNMERGRLFSDNYNKRFFEGKKGAAFSTFGRYDMYEDSGIDLNGRYQILDWLTLRAMTFYHQHQDDYISYEDWTMETPMATSTWDDDSAGISLFTDMVLDTWGNLSLTAQYRKDSHRQRGDVHFPWQESEADITTLAAEETLFFGNLSVVAGLSYSHFDATKIADNPGYAEETIDPMIGLTWKGASGLEFFGSIAKKTRFPTFNDMEYDNVMFTLKPEQNINYTVGAQYTFFERSDVRLSAFYNDVTDRIADARDAADNDIKTNLDEVKIYGAEFSSTTRFSERFSLGLDYVYTHARNTSDNRQSDYIEDVPEHQGIIRVSYLIPMIETKLNISGGLKIDTVIDENNDTMEDSFVVDISLIKEFANGFTLGGYVSNLFDENYYEGDGMASNGISFKVLGQYEF
ncbi:MAG: TonB-dependent receptor [Desulfobulbus propionicus]|nr:MAG: TonB-dependent receptor [Desulfobulbus propionicus]